MIKTFISFLLMIGISIPALAKSDIRDLKKSIVKIAIYTPTSVGPSVATAFAVKAKGKKYIVTNNHVCDSFYKASNAVLIDSQTLQRIPQKQDDIDKLDKVSSYYMHPGSDICIVTSKNVDKYYGLELASSPAEVTDDILIAGFVGRSLDLMYATGKVYGTMNSEHSVELKSCLLNPPENSSSASITCQMFPYYPIYEKKTLQVGMNNIGPGFSGSPVLKDGEVVGVVCMYFVPTEDYSNGDVIFFPLADLKKALELGPKAMVSMDSQQYTELIKISFFDQEIKQFLRSTERQLKSLVPRLIKEINE